MRQIVVILFCIFAAAPVTHATDNNDVQQGIFHSYLKLANEGDVVAQYVVAQRYENGKGIDKDMEKAFYWYEKAAEQNYPLALVKLEQRQKEQAPVKAEPPAAVKLPAVVAEPSPVSTPAPKAAPEKKVSGKKPPAAPRETVSKPKPVPAKVSTAEKTTAVSVATSPPKPADTSAPKEEQKPEQPKAPAPEIIVAKAPPSEPPVSYVNVAQVLLSGKWRRNLQEADYLPSSHATCLQSSSAEIVCFSRELQRNIDNRGLTYTVKSIISGMNNREGRFNLRYVYNVADISDKPHAAPNGMPSEVNDMAVKTGWQGPGVVMECRLRDDLSLSCTRHDRKMTYQFVRE